MKLRDIVKVIGAGDHIHIGTKHGSGWLFTGTAAQLEGVLPAVLERNVVNLYSHEGREACSTCRALRPGTAIIVEGDENGPF